MKNLNTSVYIKHQLNKDGLAPIYIRLKTNDSATAISTGYFVDKKRWNQTDGLIKTKNKDEQNIRLEIGLTIQKLEKLVDKLDEAGEVYNAKMLINMLTGKTEVTKNTNISFIQCYEAHKAEFKRINIQKRIIEGESPVEAEKNARLSHNKYNSMKEKLADYLTLTYKVQDMPMKKFDDDVQQDILCYLKGKLSHNTSQRYFISFNAIFHFAKKKKLIDEYPFTNDFKISYDRTKTPSLSLNELKTVMKKRLSSERLNVVKDIFLFLCFTGYSYADYRKLKRSNIQKLNGKTFIIWNRVKTDIEQNVPLLPQAAAILKRYENHPDCIQFGSLLPMRTDVKLNEYLKEIATLCSISKNLTTRVSRKTFGSILKRSGVQLLDIKTLIGHSDSKTTEAFYVDVDDISLIEAMDKFDAKLKIAK